MNEEEKVLKVSDWSQKWKLGIYALSGMGITYGLFKAYKVLVGIEDLLRQIVENTSR